MDMSWSSEKYYSVFTVEKRWLRFSFINIQSFMFIAKFHLYCNAHIPYEVNSNFTCKVILATGSKNKLFYGPETCIIHPQLTGLQTECPAILRRAEYVHS